MSTVMRVGLLGLLISLLAGALPAQLREAICEAELQHLPSQPPPPYPPPPTPNCERADNLIKAAASNCPSKVESFLQTGVSADLTDEDGRTALMRAAHAGNAEVAGILLDAGADPRASAGGLSALCRGARSTEVTRLFLERGLLSKVEDSCDFLARYSERGAADLVPDLIAAGFDLNKRDFRGDTPLVNAASHRNYPVVQALLEAGADPHATAFGDMRVSMIHTGDPAIVCLLLVHGADPNIRDSDGETPLMLAAHLGNEEKVRLLLQTGADPNLQDSEGRTALMHSLTGELQLQHSFVSAASKDAIAMTLLDAGADIGIKDRLGADALAFAEKHGHDKVAATLRDRLK